MGALLLTLVLGALTAPARSLPVNCSWDADEIRDFRRLGQPGYLAIDRPVVRPGQEVGISPKWFDGPFGEKSIPTACLKNWRVPKKLKLSKDRTSLKVSDTAAAGEELWVKAAFHGRAFDAVVHITGRNEQVLVGTWTQSDATGCGAGARRVAELVFSRDGRYNYTFPEMLVETMTSGRGTYLWDAPTGRLYLDGKDAAASLAGDTLRIEGYAFDPVPPEPIAIEPGTGRTIFAPQTVCRLTFRPVGIR